MRTVLVICLLMMTAGFQNCGGNIFRPLSPGNGQGYEGVKPADSPGSLPGNDVHAPPATAPELYVFAGNCSDGSSYSVIQLSSRGYELVRDNCAELNPALLIDVNQLTVLPGPPVTLIYNNYLYLRKQQ